MRENWTLLSTFLPPIIIPFTCTLFFLPN